METLYEECRKITPFSLLILDDAGLIDNLKNLWRDLKTLAKVLSTSVIAIPKIQTIGRRVILDDHIYEAADSVVLLSSDVCFNTENDAEPHITKSRSGEGVLKLKRDNQLATFKDTV